MSNVDVAYERGLAEAEALSDISDEHSLNAAPRSLVEPQYAHI